MDEPPVPELMRSIHEMFLDELKKCGAFRITLEYYETLDEGRPDKSYEWLVTQIQRYLEKKRLEDNRAKMQANLKKM
eukprot:10305911-Prorocentrum_lima.AAC.1